MNLLTGILFPITDPSLRQKDRCSLFLCLFLGLFICAGFGCILYTLNTQGRF